MVSTLKAPYPVHPMYDKSSIDDCNPRPAGHTRPEADEFMKLGTQGLVKNLLVEGQAFKPSSHAPRGVFNRVIGQTYNFNKNHLKQNIRNIQKMQRVSSARRDSWDSVTTENQEPEPEYKTLWKSEKFKDVPSKVTAELNKEQQAPRRPSSATFLRAHSRCGATKDQETRTMANGAQTDIPLATVVSGTPTTASKQSSRRALSARPAQSNASTARERPQTNLDKSLEIRGKNIDWVKLNGRAAKNAPIRRSTSSLSMQNSTNNTPRDAAPPSYRKGAVPQYLIDRHEAERKAEEERIRNMPDPDQPPGHRKLSNEDRLKTLELLKKTEAELTNQLQRLPLRQDTLRVKSLRQDLEGKLNEVEEAIKIFSKTKVFVKVEGGKSS